MLGLLSAINRQNAKIVSAMSSDEVVVKCTQIECKYFYSTKRIRTNIIYFNLYFYLD